MSIFTRKFYFSILPRLYIPIIIEQFTNKVLKNRKEEKSTGLLSTLIFELNEMKSDKIMVG